MTNGEGMTNGIWRASRCKPDAGIGQPRRAYASTLAKVLLSFVIGISLVVFSAAAHAMPTPAEQLHVLFAEDWQWRLRDQPEWATVLGDHRYGDRLRDLSPEAIAGRRDHAH